MKFAPRLASRLHIVALLIILAAPLLAGNDLSKMTPETVAMLTNRGAIAIDQDALGLQGDRVSAVGPMEIWAKPLQGGAKAVGLFNRGESAVPMTLKLSSIGFTGTAKIHDVWADKDVEGKQGTYTTVVPKHGAVLLRVSK